MIKVLFSILLMSVCGYAQTVVMWGAATGSYIDSHVALSVGSKVFIAGGQNTVASVVVTSNQSPVTPLVVRGVDWIQIFYAGNIRNQYYYNISIPDNHKNIANSRSGFFSVVTEEGVIRYDFIQAAVGVEVVEGASFTKIKKRSGTVLSMFGPDLSSKTVTAETTPLPKSLNGVQLYTTYRSSSTAEIIPATESPLFFVSPNQINFIQTHTPVRTLFSAVCYWIRTSSGDMRTYLDRTADASGNYRQSPIASIFSKASDGTGVAAAYIQTCHHGMCEVGNIIPSESETGIRIGNGWWKPIELPLNENVYVNLYVTGLQVDEDYIPKSDVEIVLNNSIIVKPSYVGASGYVGVEQVQFLLPRELSGINSAVRIKIRTKYLDSYFNGITEWSSEIADAGIIRNIIYIPVK